MSYFYKTLLQVQFKLHLHLFSPHFNYQFHGNTAALLSVIKESMRREVAKCSYLLYQSFLKKRTLVCLPSQDKAHRRFKWGRHLSRIFFRSSLFQRNGANDRIPVPRCYWASFTQCFFLRALMTWYASAKQRSRKNMLQCIYFLCTGLLPILHMTCDPQLPHGKKSKGM